MRRKPICLILGLCMAVIFPISADSSETIDPKAGKLDAEGKIVWYDAKHLAVEGKGWLDTESLYDRLPLEAKGRVSTAVWGLSRCSAGLYVRFATDAEVVQVRWTLNGAIRVEPASNGAPDAFSLRNMPASGASGIDLYVKDKQGEFRFLGNARPQNVVSIAKFDLPGGEEYVLYLPLYNGIKQLEIGIPKGKTLSKIAAPSPSSSVIFYGTSITQGGCASQPGLAATSILGRELDVPVVNLGFSGNGNMDASLAHLLAELDPAVYVLDCLANMGEGRVSTHVEPFVKILRKSRPTTPILLVEDSSIKNLPTSKGNVLRGIHEKLKKEGDKNIHFLPNNGMLGDDVKTTVDGCHHNDVGMARQAAVLVKCLEPILKERKSNN